MKSFSSFFPVGLLALLLLTLRLPAAAQAPAWQSAQAVAVATAAAVMSNNSVVRATAVDAAGNIYLAGSFTNSVVLGGTTLTSLGGDDVFLAKFNSTSNQFEWAQRAGGTDNEKVNALAVNGTSVYVTGSFGSTTADFGATNLTSAGGSDIFVAKLTDAGNMGSFTWAQRAGGIGDDTGDALIISGLNVYIAGAFGSATAGFGAATLTSAGSADIYVAKLNDVGNTGNFAWAQRAGGTGVDEAFALTASGTSIYVAGNFTSLTAGFGTTSLNSAGSADIYVAKLTDTGSMGSFAWAQRAGGTGGDYATALAVSGTSVYVAGSFGGPTAGFGNTILANAGFSDVFMAKLTDAGPTSGFVWAQRAGGTSIEAAVALAVSGVSVYMAGKFRSSTIVFGSTSLTNVGVDDVFVTKLTDSGPIGNFVWAQQAGGMGGDYATALIVSGMRVYVAGYFNSPTVSFGPIAINKPSFNSFLGFLASLTDPTLTATTAAAGPREPASLFPNPARHAATLRLPTGTAPAPLTLTDALGRAVRRYPAPVGAEAALDLRGLPAGLYLLRGAGPAQRLAVE